MSDFIEPLNLNAHPRLEKALGYRADRRWVAWHWEPQINQVMYADGESLGTANVAAWQVFLEYKENRPILQDYGLTRTDENWLLLDRKTRKLYVGDGKIVQGLLEEPESLELLAGLDDETHPLRDLRYAIARNVRSGRRSRSLRYLLTLIPVGAGTALIAALGMNTWSSLMPIVEGNLTGNQPPSAPPVLFQTIGGTGSSGDCSAFVKPATGDRELHFVGVYEADSRHGMGDRTTGTIDVKVGRRDKAIVLVLSSYEPVRWNVILEDGATVEKIILNGYHDQAVTGVEGIPIQEYSYEENGQFLGDFVYRWETTSPAVMTRFSQAAGVPLTSFQGCYRGTEFEIR
ncbi:hypothetical protein [Lyngbya sp. CCY1209]|jgi:hypothetical protein|uniref:hypothetical protein n=1 Tax=Lyngbya sp. CCY1209 TaxID=2886103 RepID=UPI002D212073|nr:hypothetical protein [Lyngbya sp. CCY1209]MEB3886451.1 hypothetical protein [Lyngbya sp. CCY1209]